MSLTEITFPEKTFDGVWAKASLLHLDRMALSRQLDLDRPQPDQSLFQVLA